MRVMQRHYFESEVPSLDEICETILQEYPHEVKIEKHSYIEDLNDIDDYENEEEKQKMEKFLDDMVGIEEGPVEINHCFLKSEGEQIELSTYTSRFKHIDLESCHTKNTYELYEFAAKILEQYGGIVREMTQDEIKQLKWKSIASYLGFFFIIALLVILYLYFNLSFLQIIGIILVFMILKLCYRIIFAYKAGKKQGWL